jgi:AcrR family transcriptional regulator
MAELDATRIAAAALAVADERGLNGFTMRAVAEALGVTPMALYHHVEDKAALAELVVNLVISERPLPAPTSGTWQDDLWEIARWTRETTLAHPVVAYLRRQYQVWTPAMLTLGERWLSMWRQSGLSLDDAVLAANSSSMAIFGAVEQEVISRERTPPSDALLSKFADARTVLTAERDHAAEFELLVRSLIDGLHTRLSGGDGT